MEQQLVDALLKDRRVERRWKIIRSVLWVAIVLFYAFIILSPFSSSSEGEGITGPYVSLLRLDGVIMPNSHFSARQVIPQLREAFSDANAKGVVLVINSPGGSPVQASIIHDKIEALKKHYHKKVVVVGEDALASGAYLVSTAADKIYVNRDTVTGSIGVIMSGFGFQGAIKKIGVARRVFTAGSHKDRLDPFGSVKASDKAKIKTVLQQVHANFIQDVLKSRKNRLKGKYALLFSGDFWTGSAAKKLGLVDGTANLWDVLHREFHVANYKDYTLKPSFLQRVTRGLVTQLRLIFTEQQTTKIQT